MSFSRLILLTKDYWWITDKWDANKLFCWKDGESPSSWEYWRYSSGFSCCGKWTTFPCLVFFFFFLLVVSFFWVLMSLCVGTISCVDCLLMELYRWKLGLQSLMLCSTKTPRLLLYSMGETLVLRNLCLIKFHQDINLEMTTRSLSWS